MKKLASHGYHDPQFQQNYERELCSTRWSDDGLSNSANVSLQLTVDVSRDSSRSDVIS